MYSQCLAIPPRRQWLYHGGYCGEVARISAGLYYGQYMSQYDARLLANDGAGQAEKQSLLLGLNDVQAARAMRLHYARWTTPGSSQAFLSWIKRHILSGCPVAIGVYMNPTVFEGEGTDREYDHIVPVLGIESPHPLTDTSYFPDDIIIYSDSGVYTPQNDAPEYIYRCRFDDFQRTRSQASSPEAPPYSLPQGVPNQGIALLGTAGLAGVRLQLDTAPRTEPEIQRTSSARPPAVPLALTLTVEGLEARKLYKLCRWDDIRRVPRGPLGADTVADSALYISVDAPGDVYTLEDSIRSDDMAIFRVVAPVSPGDTTPGAVPPGSQRYRKGPFGPVAVGKRRPGRGRG